MNCGKVMRDLGDVSGTGIDTNTHSCFRNLCLSCGTITDIWTYELDDEELINELELYEDEEIKNSKIYNELKEQEEKLNNIEDGKNISI